MTERPRDMSRAEFVARFGSVFEHSPWIAEAAFDRGLGPGADSAEGLHRAMCAVLRTAQRERKLALVRAHPDLAGRLGRAGALTEASRNEQQSAGLDACSEEELARFTALNARYRAKFGFPFVMAVKGRSRREILTAFERRIANDPETEFETALAEIEKIALFRLRELLP